VYGSNFEATCSDCRIAFLAVACGMLLFLANTASAPNAYGAPVPSA